MHASDRLVIEAKQAILLEHHRRFQDLRRNGTPLEALRQFRVTLACAADVLADSRRLLELVMADRRRSGPPTPGEAPPA